MIKQFRTEERKSDQLLDPHLSTIISKYDQDKIQPVQLREYIKYMEEEGDPSVVLRGIIGIRKLASHQVDRQQHIERKTMISAIPLLIKFISQKQHHQLCFQSLWAITNIVVNMHIDDQQETHNIIEKLIFELMKLLTSEKVCIVRQLLWVIGNLSLVCIQRLDELHIYVCMMKAISKFDCIHLFGRVCWTVARFCFCPIQSQQIREIRQQMFVLLCNKMLSGDSTIPFNITNIIYLYCFLSYFRHEAQKSNLVIIFSQIIRRHNGLLGQLRRLSVTYLTRQQRSFVINELASLYHLFIGSDLGQQIFTEIKDQLRVFKQVVVNRKDSYYRNFIRKSKLANLESIQRLNSMVTCTQKQVQIANFLLSSERFIQKIVAILDRQIILQIEKLFQFFNILTSKGDAALVLSLVEKYPIFYILMRYKNAQHLQYIYQIFINIFNKIEESHCQQSERIISLFYEQTKKNPYFEQRAVLCSNQIIQQLYSRLQFMLSDLSKSKHQLKY